MSLEPQQLLCSMTKMKWRWTRRNAVNLWHWETIGTMSWVILWKSLRARCRRVIRYLISFRLLQVVQRESNSKKCKPITSLNSARSMTPRESAIIYQLFTCHTRRVHPSCLCTSMPMQKILYCRMSSLTTWEPSSESTSSPSSIQATVYTQSSIRSDIAILNLLMQESLGSLKSSTRTALPRIRTKEATIIGIDNRWEMARTERTNNIRNRISKT